MLFRKHNLTNLLHLITIITGLVVHVTPKKCLEHVKAPRQFLQVETINGIEMWNLTLETSEDSLGHQLVTHAFAIFLQEVLGYDAVQVERYPMYYNTNSTTDILRRLSGMELVVENGAVLMSPSSNNFQLETKLPETMINVAVWLSPEMELEKWNTPGILLENCGHLGFVGRFGWFIPRLPVTDKYPTVEYWRTFRMNESLTELFSLDDVDYQNATTHLAWNPQTERFYCQEKFCESGMYTPDICRSNSPRNRCAILLASYPESSMFLPQEISSLGLRVRVIWLGPHLEGFVRHLVSKYKRSSNRTVMFFSWDPTRLTSELDLISVSFPSCTGGVHCRYESLRLEKFVSSRLKEGAKPAYEAAHRLSLTYDEYKRMLETYTFVRTELDNEIDLEEKNALQLWDDGGKYPGSIVEQAACRWMKENKVVWESWEPKLGNGKVPLFIGGIFPITGSYTARGILVAAQMATIAVNRNSSVLKDYDLRMHVYDGQCRADKVMKGFIDYIRLNTFPSMAGILGPACSDTAEPLAGVATHFKTVVVSYSAEGSSFSDRQKYPYFFRTIGENKQYQNVYLDLFRQLSWTRVASLTEEGQKYAEYVSSLQDLMQENQIAFIANRKFPKDKPALNMSQYLQDLKIKKAKIIIGDFYDHAARAVMCEAYHQKMTAREGFVWFLPVWFLKDWYDADKHNALSDEKESVPCNTSEMIQAINGHLSLQYAYFAPEDHLMQENITVGRWKKQYEQSCGNKSIETSDYAGYAYDAIWTYAYALDKLLKQNHSHITNLHSDKTTNELVRIIKETNFNGVSGNIRFVGGPSRISTIHVVQWYNRTTRIVGSYHPKDPDDDENVVGKNRLKLNMSLIRWLTPDGSMPTDGSEPPPVCVLETLASALDVSCEVAIVIANVIGFGILGFILVICFLVIKRRYDKNMQRTQDYLNALGIDILSATNVSALDKWEIPRDRVVINRKLGEGAFGTVYGGECFFDDRGWVAVAVKTLKMGSSCEQKLDFLGEAEVMKRFEHKNIVRLLGVCTKNEPVYTIMEFMLYGDLKTYLLARRHLVNEKNCEESDEISSRRLTSMSLDVARALSYLAELKYVHRDVACRNCLVNASRVVKLGDFGMTRPMYENDYYRFNRKGMLPVRWMAPESLALGIFTPMSDVWSFGVLLYEIITFGSFPFQGKSNNEVLDYVKSGNTVSIPAGVKPQLEQLLKSCWSLESQKRPAAAVIVEFLANNPRIISPCLDIPLASVQLEGTDQLELQIPDRFSFNRKPNSAAVKNGGKGIPKSVRESRDIAITNNLSGLGEENIPLTGQKTTYENKRNPAQSSYVSLHHDPNAVEADLI